MRSVIQRNSAPCAASMSARNAKRPSAMRQYRLWYQRGSDICRLVAGAPDGENHRRFRGVVFDLFPDALDQRVDAADGDERIVFPDLAEQRLAAEHNAGIGEQHVEQLELVRRELDMAVARLHRPAPPIDLRCHV